MEENNQTISYFVHEGMMARMERHTRRLLPVIDDLMTKLQLVNPKLYEDTMKKIRR